MSLAGDPDFFRIRSQSPSAAANGQHLLILDTVHKGRTTRPFCYYFLGRINCFRYVLRSCIYFWTIDDHRVDVVCVLLCAMSLFRILLRRAHQAGSDRCVNMYNTLTAVR